MKALLLRIAAPLATLAVALLLALPAAAQSQGTKARAVLVIDLSSGAVLLEKNADEPLPPASMSKLMTLYMVFEALEKGVISMNDEFPTSRHAASMKGSSMFLRQGEQVSVANLLRGVIVQSGNDAAVVLAEGLAGTEEVFAERMNRRAEELGLRNATFSNATGWPDPSQAMSVRDLATLARLIITDFPDYYAMFDEREFTWDEITQENRNPLLDRGLGADGLKTGHTQEAGYGLVASAKRGDRRVIVVVAGLETADDRLHEAEQLVKWAFRAFETRRLYAAGEALPLEAEVWLGAAPTVPLAAIRDIVITAPYGTLDNAELKLRYHGPVEAPIEEGQEIAKIEIRVPELDPVFVPLVAKQGVEVGGFLTRMQAVGQILFDKLNPL